jgi:hypothetical protein
MENLHLFWNQYSNYIIIILSIFLSFLAGKNNGVIKAIADVYDVIKTVVVFFAKSLSEEDGNGGKPSFSRILGTYALFEIVAMAWVKLYAPTTYSIPAEMMTLFYFTIGYAMLSKVFSTASPLLQQLIAAYLQKVQNLALPQNKPADSTKA